MISTQSLEYHPAFLVGSEQVVDIAKKMASAKASLILDGVDMPLEEPEASTVTDIVRTVEFTEILSEYDGIEVLSIGLVAIELKRNGYNTEENADLADGLFTQVNADLEVGEAFDTLNSHGALE